MKRSFTALGLTAAGTALAILALRNRQAIPAGATAVNGFDLDKYLGRWYEIARLDFIFEENMNHTTATYSLREDGLVKVENRGFDKQADKWKQSVGKARFSGNKTVAALEVSFFGPFYAPYNVIALADDYKYALVTGKNTDYLWLLSRERTMPEDIKNRFLTRARTIGYDTDKLVWPSQELDYPLG